MKLNNIVNAINLLTQAIRCVRIVPVSAYAYAYLSATAPTTITVANTFYKIAGVTTAILNEKFTHTNNRLTYIGEPDQLFRISVGLSVTSDTGSQLIKYCAAINGVAIPHSQLSHKTGATGSDVIALAGQKMIEMKKDDYLEVFITCDNAGVELTAEYMTITIH